MLILLFRTRARSERRLQRADSTAFLCVFHPIQPAIPVAIQPPKMMGSRPPILFHGRHPSHYLRLWSHCRLFPPKAQPFWQRTPIPVIPTPELPPKSGHRNLDFLLEQSATLRGAYSRTTGLTDLRNPSQNRSDWKKLPNSSHGKSVRQMPGRGPWTWPHEAY